jgi:hypothetical protein
VNERVPVGAENRYLIIININNDMLNNEINTGYCTNQQPKRVHARSRMRMQELF